MHFNFIIYGKTMHYNILYEYLNELYIKGLSVTSSSYTDLRHSVGVILLQIRRQILIFYFNFAPVFSSQHSGIYVNLQCQISLLPYKLDPVFISIVLHSTFPVGSQAQTSALLNLYCKRFSSRLHKETKFFVLFTQ